MHFLLFFDVSHEYLERRGEYGSAHLEKGWAASERGELVPGDKRANASNPVLP